MTRRNTNSSIEGLPASYFTMEDLYLAYKKTKVDTFYEREIVLSFEFADFEENLNDRLTNLHERLIQGNWMDDPDIFGECVFIPKSLDFLSQSEDIQDVRMTENTQDKFAKTIHTSALKNWKEIVKQQKPKIPHAKFRPISRPSIEWLVISALWIMKAGKKLDACLGNSVMGSRLRRKKDGSFNMHAIGCFAPYAPAYGKWRSNGLRAIRQEIEEKRNVVALTADLRSFYHSVDPSFLCSSRFLELVNERTNSIYGDNLDANEYKMQDEDWIFTAQIVKSFKAWAEHHKALFPGEEPIGLPIGPGATRIIANLVLLGFDQFIERNLQPLYYGRYVDDVFLVMRDGIALKNAEELWDRIEKLSCEDSVGNCRIQRESENETEDEQVCRLYLDYDCKNKQSNPRSNLRFAGKKQKVFFIEGVAGKALLDSIEHQIRLNSSEWRHLPDLPKFDHDIHADYLVANHDESESVDNLRKADRISIRRLRFALHLRDMEALAEDLEPTQWKQPRDKLFEFVLAHLTGLPEIFTYAPYIPRIMALAVQSDDWEKTTKLIKEISGTFKQIETDCNINEDHLRLCRKDFGDKLITAVVRALHPSLWKGTQLPEGFKELIHVIQDNFTDSIDFVSESCQHLAEKLFLHDLGIIPFRKHLLDGKDTKHCTPPTVILSNKLAKALGIPTIRTFLDGIKSGMDNNAPLGMIFPTRPLSPPEITLLYPDLLDPDHSAELNKFVKTIRGTQFVEMDYARIQQWKKWFPTSTDCDERDIRGQKDIPAIWIPNAVFEDTVRICLPCLMVEDDSWVASITQDPDPDLTRYIRITRAINASISSHNPPHYIVMPELALKSQWFNRFAYKLSKSRISLISGIEYQHYPYEGIRKDEVVNSIRVSLVTNYPGYWTYLLHSQNKENPAPHEEAELFRIFNKHLAKGTSGKKIIRHGDFQFGILICSELTNIDFRAKLRGNIDALIAPQWNKDIESFSPLIEATANDLHTYVVQSNNRQYGDSRIRAPYKDQWKRDILRLKGGIEDYHAIGEIDFMTLRRFQSSYRSPQGPFKPVPDGFKIHSSRKELPLTES